MQCISVDFTSASYSQVLMKEKWRISCLCSPLICCRMQGKRTDYCKVRIEVLNLFLGEKQCIELVKPVSITSVIKCDDSSLFQRVIRRIETIASFAKLSIIQLSRPFEEDLSLYASLFGLISRLRARSQMTMFVCYSYAPIISGTFVLKLMKAKLVLPQQKTLLLWRNF